MSPSSRRQSRTAARASGNGAARGNGTGNGAGNGSAGSGRSVGGGRGRRGPVRYAVIGLGHIAQVAVLPAFRNARKNSVLTALVSDDEKKLKTLGHRYKVPYVVDYEQANALFRSGEIDAVYIALPNDLHEPWTARAARAGLHVLCEKPMDISSAKCERMMRAAREGGVKLMIAYRLHFERATLEVAKLVRQRRIGDARYFNSQFSFQVSDDNIRVKAERGGGPVWDIGIYCINAARHVFAAEPTEVWATAINSGDKRFREVPETVSAVLKFPENRVATFTCSFGSADRSRYEIVGTKGSVAMEPAYEYAEGLEYELTIGEKTQKKKFSKSDQFAPELIYFSDCIRKNREPEPSGEEGLADVRVIEAIHRSVKSGSWTSVGAKQRRRRPAMRQEIRRPGISKPQTVNVQSPH